MEIDVYGKKIPVKYTKNLKNEDGHSCFGTYCDTEKRIEIDSGIKKNSDLWKITLLHESGHALFKRLNIELKEEIEEIIVEAFSNMVVENWNIKLK